MRAQIAVASIVIAGTGCGGGAEDTSAGSVTVTSTTTPGPTTSLADDTVGVLDVGNGGATVGAGDDQGCDVDDIAPRDAMLEGIVLAPNMEIPISGALVYVGHQPAEPVPDEVYCAECVALSCDVDFVLTEPDGTFRLPAASGAGQHLVVQKGQFLRDVVIDVAEGTNTVPPDQTNLPGEWDPDAGMWIPRIAVYETDPDQVFNVLAKFGLGEVSASGTLVPGTQRFTLVPDADEGAFMDDPVEMSQYHIIFVPCAATKYWDIAPTVPAQRAQNIRDYVEAGGKWYATDHSNEYIEEPFPMYVDFHNPAMPDIQPAYDVTGTVADPDLLAWLDALPPALKDIGGGNPTLGSLPSIELMLNYSGIDAIHEVLVEDDEGNEVDVGPYAWVNGPCTSCTSDPFTYRPMAVTGQWGCGRMMYSTFENSSVAHQGLNPQELVLLYMILEIGVCHDRPPPPIPPVG